MQADELVWNNRTVSFFLFHENLIHENLSFKYSPSTVPYSLNWEKAKSWGETKKGSVKLHLTL